VDAHYLGPEEVKIGYGVHKDYFEHQSRNVDGLLSTSLIPMTFCTAVAKFPIKFYTYVFVTTQPKT
jgi:hypothetical protein